MMRSGKIKPPYPWFGGKSRIAPLVWSRFGDVKSYVEPFFGGGAVLLAAPWPSSRYETVNDINAWLCNFWRAVKHDPDGVAEYASDPISELDLHARGDALFYKGVQLDDKGRIMPDEFVERMRSDPEFYDVKIAGWWVWGQGAWIGVWGPKGKQRVPRQVPHLNRGQGVHRLGIYNPDLGQRESLRRYLRKLSSRFERVRVCCGDWTRVVGKASTVFIGTTGIFLDPPYAAKRRSVAYDNDDFDLAHAVAAWAIEHGDDPRLRIAMCGYEGDYRMPESWDCVSWTGTGGWSRIRRRSGKNLNRYRERIWFSPHCLRDLSGQPFACMSARFTLGCGDG